MNLLIGDDVISSNPIFLTHKIFYLYDSVVERSLSDDVKKSLFEDVVSQYVTS